MLAIYGALPVWVADVPPGATQYAPEHPGSASLEAVPSGSLTSCIMHAPDGRLERRYALALALRALRIGGDLTVLAPKRRGGARLGAELEEFGCDVADAAKHHYRICTTRRPRIVTHVEAAIGDGAPRLIEELGLWSQPGVFSWDRIDPGSALLIAHLPELKGRGADLGCGIGVLARAVLSQTGVEHLTMIDIDRRAVEAARHNVDASRSTLAWADATRLPPLQPQLDFVVMNPPFHRGGEEDQNLGRKFIECAATMLRRGAICLITANRHLPYEGVMKPLFTEVTQLVQAKGFKVYAARK